VPAPRDHLSDQIRDARAHLDGANVPIRTVARRCDATDSPGSVTAAAGWRTGPKLAELIRDVSHLDIPADERFEANGELSRSFLDEIASPDEGDIPEALPVPITRSPSRSPSLPETSPPSAEQTDRRFPHWLAGGRH